MPGTTAPPTDRPSPRGWVSTTTVSHGWPGGGVHDPSVTDEADPFSVDPELDMYHPDIDPDGRNEACRAPGTIFAFPDPLETDHGASGLGRVMTPRGWQSTWSGLSARAAMSANMPGVTIPTLVVHPTADTEIRAHHAEALAAASGADDMTYEELPGAPHYLEGNRVEGMQIVADRLAARS